MGIRFTCPNGHKLHVKAFLAGKRGVCPQCGARILIPAEADSPPPVPHPPTVPPGAGRVESASAAAGTFSESASPSIVISVADSPAVPGQFNGESSPVPSPEAGILSPQTLGAPVIVPSEPQPLADTPPLLVPDARESESPAARYAARRERNRRNQLVIAVMLLVAVIVLAGVLVMVLKRGSASAPAQNSAALASVGLGSPGPIAGTVL